MSNFLKIGLFSRKIAIISITILGRRIFRQQNDSPGSPLSICALRLLINLILYVREVTKGKKVRFLGNVFFS